MHGANGLLLAAMFDAQMVRWIVWSGLVALTLALLVLMRTRWGQSHPLRKCIVLSLVAHLLLGIYTTTVNIVAGGRGPNSSGPLRVAFIASDVDGLTNADVASDADRAEERSWETLGTSPVAELTQRIASQPAAFAPPEPGPAPKRHEPTGRVPDEIARPSAPTSAADHGAERRAAAAAPTPAAPIEAPRATRTAANRAMPDRPETAAMPAPPEPDGEAPRPAAAAAPSDVFAAIAPAAVPVKETGKERNARSPVPAAAASEVPMEAVTRPPGAADSSAAGNGTSQTPGNSKSDGSPAALAGTAAPKADAGEAAAHPLPQIYELRMEPDRLRAAIGHGGTRETEAAVKQALGWLSSAQNADGRWSGRRLEAGRGTVIDGQDRRDAGTQADTGLTGLTLLAFLASGHTHREGDHREQVRRGIDFLVSTQAADGNLGGQGTLYEKMYCHAMATFALSECCAMSQDDRLRTPVQRAIDYTLRSQQPGGGGWRYQPREQGDMSQLGWQFMALKSAELAGIPIPTETRLGMLRFIGSVTSGKHQGLASYRPGHRTTRTMTAEALVCRQFLGLPRTSPACDEAGDFLLAELPGQGKPNFYYWYYGTLAMYQLQGDRWKQWNEALQNTLVGSQRSDGSLAGSWDPDPVWGTCGGRAYSTALGTLCLEVYYRYLPFHIEAASLGRQPK